MSTPNPATTPWVLLGAGGGALKYLGDYAAGTYNDGDCVVYNGVLYLCTQNGVTAAPTAWPPPGAQDAIPKSLVDNPGDLLVATANDVVAKLPVGALGQGLQVISAAPGVGWQTSIGAELDYAQITASVTGVTASTEATAVTLVSGNSVTYDGSKIKVEVYVPAVAAASSLWYYRVLLLRDTTVIGYAAGKSVGGDAANGFEFYAAAFDTPAAGAHTYKASAYVQATTNFSFLAGAGGSGNLLPAFLRVSKA